MKKRVRPPIAERAGVLILALSWGRAAILGVLLLLLPFPPGETVPLDPTILLWPGDLGDIESAGTESQRLAAPELWARAPLQTAAAIWQDQTRRPAALPYLVLIILAGAEAVLAALGSRLAQRFVASPIQQFGTAARRAWTKARIAPLSGRDGDSLRHTFHGLEAMADELQQLRERLCSLSAHGEAFIEDAPVGLLLASADLRVVAGNRVFRAMTGAQGRQIAWEPVEHLLGWVELPEATAAVLAGQRSHQVLVLKLPATGRGVSLTITRTPGSFSFAPEAQLMFWVQDLPARHRAGPEWRGPRCRPAPTGAKLTSVPGSSTPPILGTLQDEDRDACQLAPAREAGEGAPNEGL